MSLSDEHYQENAGLQCSLGIQTGGSFILALLRWAVFAWLWVTLIMRCVINLITASQTKKEREDIIKTHKADPQ